MFLHRPQPRGDFRGEFCEVASFQSTHMSIFFRYFPFSPKNPTCGAEVHEGSTHDEIFATRLSHFAFCSTCGATGPKKGGEIAKKTRRAAVYGKKLKISPQIGQIIQSWQVLLIVIVTSYFSSPDTVASTSYNYDLPLTRMFEYFCKTQKKPRKGGMCNGHL